MRARSSHTSTALLLSIGSGSVGFAIVDSAADQADPTIHWHTREHIAITPTDLERTRRSVTSALTDAALRLSADGLPALAAAHQNSRPSIDHIYVTVAAPWAHTVSQPVTYEQPQPFTLTADLLAHVAATAATQANTQFTTHHPQAAKQVTLTSEAALCVYANGYRVPSITKQSTDNLRLFHAITPIDHTLVAAVRELAAKLFPKATLHITSEQLAFFYALRHRTPGHTDCSLITVTDEATEIGIVRNGTLRQVTHTPHGTVTLARALSAATNRPAIEILSRLDDLLTAPPTPSITGCLDEYRQGIEAMCAEVSDTLAVPHRIWLLAEPALATAVGTLVAQAVTKASKTSAHSTPLYAEADIDTGLQVAADFFHTTRNNRYITYQ